MAAQLTSEEAAGYLDLVAGLAQTTQDSTERILSGLRELAQLQQAPQVVQERPSDLVITQLFQGGPSPTPIWTIPASMDRLRVTIRIGAETTQPVFVATDASDVSTESSQHPSGLVANSILLDPGTTLTIATRAALYIRGIGESDGTILVSVLSEFTRPQPGEIGHKHYNGCGCC